MKRILITGIAGFIGFHLSKKLSEEDFEILGVDSMNDYYDPELKYDRLSELGFDKKEAKMETGVIKSNKHSNLKFLKADLSEKESINKIFKEFSPDLVIHLAAQAGVRYSIEKPEKYIESNVVGFFNILEACRHNNIKDFIYASSSSVYGDSDKYPVKEEFDTSKPVSLYAASKKFDEVAAYVYSNMFKINTIGLRFFTVYGPWYRPDMALFKFTESILSDKEIDVYNNGDMYRDFTFVGDIVDGILAIVKKVVTQEGSDYKIYNIGRGKPIKLSDYIEELENALGKKAKKNFKPLQPGDVLKTYADTSAIEKDYGYKPSTDIKEGIGEFVKWYKQYYRV